MVVNYRPNLDSQDGESEQGKRGPATDCERTSDAGKAEAF